MSPSGWLGEFFFAGEEPVASFEVGVALAVFAAGVAEAGSEAVVVAAGAVAGAGDAVAAGGGAGGLGFGGVVVPGLGEGVELQGELVDLVDELFEVLGGGGVGWVVEESFESWGCAVVVELGGVVGSGGVGGVAGLVVLEVAVGGGEVGVDVGEAGDGFEVEFFEGGDGGGHGGVL